MNPFPLAIRGIGVHGGFGCSAVAFREAFRGGGMPNGVLEVHTADGVAQVAAYTADTSPLGSYIPRAKLRRVNRFSKLALLGACMALEDAGLQLGDDLSDLGIIVASGYGASQSTFDFLDSMIEDGGSCPSPTVFANSVHSSAASNLSILLGSHGPCLTVSQFGLSPVSGLLTAREWLRSGRVQTVLFGAVDELCPVLAYSYERFFPGHCSGPIRPLELDLQTAVPGEGAAFLVLDSAGGDRGYGWITDVVWGAAEFGIVPSAMRCVLGAEGHVCCADQYRRVLSGVDGEVSVYSPARGSLPSGQAFDIVGIALSAGEAGRSEACSVTCDASGTCGACFWQAAASS